MRTHPLFSSFGRFLLSAATAAVLLLAATADAQTLNKCSSKKKLCVAKKMACLLKCHAKAEKTGLPVDANCTQKCMTKFDGGVTPAKGCFEKLEDKNPPLSATACLTFDDTAALEAKIDAFVLDVVQEVDPAFPAPVLNKCSSGKKKCVSKKTKALLKCHAKAEKKGLVVDPVCIQKAHDKFDGGADPTKGCFEKLENKVPNDCVTFDDTAAAEAKVDAFVFDVVSEVDPNFATPTPTLTAPVPTATPTTTPTATQTPPPVLTTTPTPTFTVAPTVTATQTPGPGATVTPTATSTPLGCDLTGQPCPTLVQSDANGDLIDLDTGWTGQSHDSHAPSNGRLTLNSSCPGSTHPTCGVCTLSGPATNAGGMAFNNRRCITDTAITCTTNADCPGASPCRFHFGAPLPLSAGGVSVCVTNEITQAVTGTMDVNAGTSQANVILLSRVHNGPTVDRPCPTCEAGLCTAGPHMGDPCTINGSSPSYGDLSYDCPPDVAANIGNLPVPLDLRTGTQTKTLSAAGPNCTQTGFTGLECFCGTCNSASAEPCDENADCPDPAGPVGPICAGRRCVGGANIGAACSVNSECPGATCSPNAVNSKATRPNECDDTVCAANPPDTDSIDEGVCSGGPFELFCAPAETFRGCSTDGDCPVPGDTCTGGRFRECFTDDNGAIGGDVSVGGVADPFTGNTSNPTLGALFCIAPTSSSSVNSVTGLPGLGRVTIPSTAQINNVVCATSTPGAGTPTPTVTRTPTKTPTPGLTVTATPTPTATATPLGNCGNGMLDVGETCDPTAPPPGVTCDPTQCVPPSEGAPFACTCATGQMRTLFDPGSELDSGWTGVSHNASTAAPTDADTLLYDCDGVTDTLCRQTGPRAGVRGYRCELNPRMSCSTNADCAPLNGRCGVFLGPPLPLSSGGVPVCVTTFFVEPITGTVNVTDGSSATFQRLASRVHVTPAIDAPCPRCNCIGVGCSNTVGTTGLCNSGPGLGMACTIEGVSPFGPMSRDCPPENGANVTGAGLDVRFAPNTTGTSTKTATLPCTAAGFTQFNTCACDTCNDAAAGPCASNADCTDGPDAPGAPVIGAVCGGLRCIGGPDAGDACTTAAQCGVGNTCSRPGLLTQPNQCELGCLGGANANAPCTVDSECPGGSCIPLCAQIPGSQCVGGANDDATCTVASQCPGGSCLPVQTGMGECVVGPSDAKCENEEFRGCTTDADCNAPPPTCTGLGAGTCLGCTMCNQACVTTPRPCHVFPMSLVGDPNAFTGTPATGTSSGNSVTTFCIPPTSAAAVNSSAGLPGEGSLLNTHNYTKTFPSVACPVSPGILGLGNKCP